MTRTQLAAVPLFWDTEIQCGRQLGKGTYCDVLAVQDIIILRSSSDDQEEELPKFDNNGDGSDYDNTTAEDLLVKKYHRQLLADKFVSARDKRPDRSNAAIYGKPITGHPPKEIDDPTREAAPKLALKRLRKRYLVVDSSTNSELPTTARRALEQAHDDFQRELNILLSIKRHPNIVDLYGI